MHRSRIMDELFDRLDKIDKNQVAICRKLTKEIKKMSNELDNLTAQVAASIDVQKSAIILINGLATQIVALKNDPVALQALADSLVAEKNDLSAAVVANTPAQ